MHACLLAAVFDSFGSYSNCLSAFWLKPGSQFRTGSEPLSFLKKEAGNRFISLAFICTFFGASVNVLQIIFAEGGPNRIIKPEKIVAWQELKREFLSISAITRRTGTDRKTIRKLSGRGLTDKIGMYTDIRRKRLGRPLRRLKHCWLSTTTSPLLLRSRCSKSLPPTRAICIVRWMEDGFRCLNMDLLQERRRADLRKLAA